jgi:hypothetical protein
LPFKYPAPTKPESYVFQSPIEGLDRLADKDISPIRQDLTGFRWRPDMIYEGTAVQAIRDFPYGECSGNNSLL